MKEKMNSELLKVSNPNTNIRMVHLDLKGLPPTPQRLLELLPVITAAGYNALLVEWEDMFPWTVDKRFCSRTAYTPEEVKSFLSEAKRLGLEIVPLVQSIGHMETFLGIHGYEHLLEDPDFCDVLNPLADGAGTLIKRLVRDVLALCPDICYFHLGGDEAWNFGTHPDTHAYIQRHGKGSLYLKHMEPILEMLCSQGIRPILWHDMMIDWSDEALARLKDKTDLMVWDYGDPPTRYLERFHKLGFQLWGATAYKGVDRDTGDLPIIANRQRNTVAWVELAKKFNFKGMAATAWSRYSTHRPQTCPIDSALDSLLFTGMILYNGSIIDDGYNACLSVLKSLGEAERFNNCYSSIHELSEARKEVWQIIQYLWEQIAIESRYTNRRGSKISTITLKDVQSNFERFQKAAEHVHKTFVGLVDSIWIEEYLQVRGDSVQMQIKMAQLEIKKTLRC